MLNKIASSGDRALYIASGKIYQYSFSTMTPPLDVTRALPSAPKLIATCSERDVVVTQDNKVYHRSIGPGQVWLQIDNLNIPVRDKITHLATCLSHTIIVLNQKNILYVTHMNEFGVKTAPKVSKHNTHGPQKNFRNNQAFVTNLTACDDYIIITMTGGKAFLLGRNKENGQLQFRTFPKLIPESFIHNTKNYINRYQLVIASDDNYQFFTREQLHHISLNFVFAAYSGKDRILVGHTEMYEYYLYVRKESAGVEMSHYFKLPAGFTVSGIAADKNKVLLLDLHGNHHIYDKHVIMQKQYILHNYNRLDSSIMLHDTSINDDIL